MDPAICDDFFFSGNPLAGRIKLELPRVED
jgi:hypothetical protein